MNPNEPQGHEPVPQTQTPQPSTMPTPVLASVPAYGRSGGSGKAWVVFLAIGLLVAVIIAAALVFWQKNRHGPTGHDRSETQAVITEGQKEENATDEAIHFTETNCYRFATPDNYTVSSQSASCKVKLTNKSTPTAVIDVGYVTGLDDIPGNAAVYAVERTKTIAKQQGLQVGGSEELKVNDYTTGVLYFENADKQQKAFYAIDNESRKSNTSEAKSISVFTVTGIMNTEQQAADLRLMVSSFRIK